MTKRSQKTKDSLRRALLELLVQKDIAEITVTELCLHANIHRKTFYSYYHNTMDILDELFQELISDISAIHVELLLGNFKNFEVFFQYVDNFILKNIEYYQLLSKTNQYIIFINKVDDYFSKTLLEKFDKDFKLFSSVNKYTIYFLVSGIANLYMRWIKDPNQCPISYISSTCAVMCNKLLSLKGTN